MSMASEVEEMLELDSREAFAAAVASRMLLKVEKFNLDVLAFPVPAVPTLLNPIRQQAAADCLQEELDEFKAANEAEDILESADALIDLVYFALGRLVEMGVPAEAVFQEVQRANMEKVRGDLSKRPGWNGHDAVKPEGWKAPDHSWLLGFSLNEYLQLKEQADLREAISPVWLELQRLREEKGQDYNDVPGGRDAYFPFGHLSYAHMVHTKNLRLQSLLAGLQKGRPVNFEGIYDTVKDLVNYGTYYAGAIRDGRLEGGEL